MRVEIGVSTFMSHHSNLMLSSALLVNRMNRLVALLAILSTDSKNSDRHVSTQPVLGKRGNQSPFGSKLIERII